MKKSLKTYLLKIDWLLEKTIYKLIIIYIKDYFMLINNLIIFLNYKNFLITRNSNLWILYQVFYRNLIQKKGFTKFY